MTTEEKAKAYDEALEKARKRVATEPQDRTAILKDIFPQLRDSEDERIRKWIIDELKDSLHEIEAMYSGDYDNRDEQDKEREAYLNKALAYLEKQKEQNGKDEEDNDFTIYHPLKNGKGEYECIPYSFCGSLTSFSEDKDLIDFLRTCFYTEEECNEWIEQQKEQKLIPKFKVGDCIYDKRDSYNRNVIREVGKDYYINAFAQKMDMAYTDANFEFLEHLDNDLIDSKPAEWSEEDDRMLTGIIERGSSQIPSHEPALRGEQMEWLMNRLKFLRPQPKAEREPMEIKYGGKVYQVYAVKSLPGGAIGYIIEDEPGHYDCIINPDEVLGGGYGIKQNGSPYPTKEATFDYPHWKPSEEQTKALNALNLHGGLSYVGQQNQLISLYQDLKKLM